MTLAGRQPARARGPTGAWILLQLALEIAPQAKQLDEGAYDHDEASARWTARGAREMADRQLGDPKATAARLDQELRAERRAARVHRQAFPDLSAKQLESAVDIARRIAEQRIHQHFPAQRVQLAHGWISAILSPADDHVRLPVQGRHELAQFGDVELLVAVGQEDPVLALGVEAAGQRGAVAAIAFVGHHTQVQVRIASL